MKDVTDKELVEDFVAGNRQAFALIFERHFQIVFGYVFVRVGNKSWTEDIVSDTFQTLLTVIHKYDGSAKLATFIIGVARNKMLQYLENLPAGQRSLDDELEEFVGEEVELEEDESSKAEIELANSILENLPPNYRQVLTLRFIEGLSIKAVAAELNLTESNVKVLQHRALKKALQIWKNLN